MDLGEVVGVLRKRLSWIATAAVVGLVTSGLWTFTRAPLYKATAQIEVVGPPQADLVKEAGLTVASDSSEFETHRYLLTTDRTLKAVVTAIDLPKRLGKAGAGATWLRAHVVVDRVPDTRIFRITATAPEPALAADIANAIATVYRQDDIDRRSKGSEKTMNSLNEQLLTVKKDVEGSELALIQYIETANLDLVDVPGENDTKGGDLNPSGSKILAGLEEDLETKRRELDDERIDRTEEHPAIQRLKQQISNRQKQIFEEKKRVTEENKKRIRYGMLKRDAELNRELLQVLMKALKEANLLGDAPQGRIDVLEDAVVPDPRRPVSPKPAVNLGMGLGAGILFGIGLAFLQESLDRTLKSREEIERALGLPVLGVVHRVRRDAPAATSRFRGFLPSRRGPADAPVTGERFVLKADGSWSPELEDFRSLRTNLRFARPEGENKTVLVTSTAPQEGKTTIATNLAVVAAQAGERVLLVDADLRRPAIHLALSMANERGLTNLLVERAGEPEGDAIKATAWPNLSVITAGAFAPNPPEILESARCAELIAGWSKRFDRVIIDSPPQSSVVDPAILAPRVDGVLLVVSSGRIDPERARLARRQLAAAGAKFFGAVINQLARSRDPYAYGYDYGYGYGYGHRTANGNGQPPTDDRERPAAAGK